MGFAEFCILSDRLTPRYQPVAMLKAFDVCTEIRHIVI